MAEWHSGQKQTAKVIIICGHAPSHAHLTDGDNLSQHFSIKKENTNKQKERENTHSRAHTKTYTQAGNTEMTLRTWYLIKSDAPSLQTG